MYLRLIPHSGLGVPTSKDKTDSPTPEAYTSTLSGTGIATDAGAIVSYLHGCYKPPSLNVEAVFYSDHPHLYANLETNLLLYN